MSKTADQAHERWMRAALVLAERGLGGVSPNPAVGCILVRDGRPVGRGWTQMGGRPHAETEALRQAGAAAKGATCYVTLEPCNHHGQTPPCVDALIEAGVARVVAALRDPDRRTDGSGLARLAASGIEVVEGVLGDEAAALNEGFVRRVREGRPMVTLKLATSLDGKIAAKGGASQWITGPVARAEAHRLRATHDAILVGLGPVLADDPELTCRLPGLGDRSPIRVVLDGSMRTPANARLRRTGGPKTWLVTRPGVNASAHCGAIEIEPDAEGLLPPAAILRALAKRGVTRLLIEGGGAVASSFLKADLVDRLAWFRAPAVMGADGVGGVGPLGLAAPGAMPRFVRDGVRNLGDDLLETFRRRA